MGEVELGAGEHVVQFYERDGELARSVGEYLVGAVRAGGVAMVIATEPHRRAFAGWLAAAGVDLARAVETQVVLWLDAADVLARLMPEGGIDAEAFRREVGSAIADVAAGGGPVCVYGEMVQLLWDAGKAVAALELESLWNDVVGEHRCSLMCAYRRSSVSGPEHAEALQRVCELHSSVLHAPGGEDGHTGDAHWTAAEVAEEFVPGPDAPGAARRFVVDTLRRWGHDAALIEDAGLVVSELATNAVIHARSPFAVAARASDRGVRLAVRDPSPRPPAIRDPAPSTGAGWGLRLLAALASDWGIDTTPPGKTVWAHLHADASSPSARRARASGSASVRATDPDPAGSPHLSARRESRSERAALYRRTADTLERAAQLAERHAADEQPDRRHHPTQLEHAARAREAARRARVLAVLASWTQ